jgi:hypothetical protein
MIRVFQNRQLRKIFGPKVEEVKEAEHDDIMRIFIMCTHNHIQLSL